MGGSVSPETTLVILLGASAWPKAPSLGASESFANSAKDLRAYFLRGDGFALPHDNLLDLFDNDSSPAGIDESIANFLRAQTNALRERGTPTRDLVVYYVGHGGFLPDGDSFFLALRATRQGGESTSGLTTAALARTLKDGARHVRRFVIFDCCFSAAAYSEFQSPPLEVARRKTLESFPGKGTALLCSSGPRDPSRAPKDAMYTMFSGALLDALTKGEAGVGPMLSLKDLSDLVRDIILNRYPDDAVRPEVHSPDQRDGDLATMPFFPNPIHRPKPVGERLSELESRVDLLDESTAQRVLDPRFSQFEARIESLTEELRALGRTLETVPAQFVQQRPPSRAQNYEWYLYPDSQGWDTLSPLLKNEIRLLRRARWFGVAWICAAALSCVTLVGWAGLVDPVPYNVQWRLVVAGYHAVVTVSLISLVTLARGPKALNLQPFETDQALDPLVQDAVVGLSSRRVYRLVGTLRLSSPQFELGAITYVTTAVILSLGIVVRSPLTWWR